MSLLQHIGNQKMSGPAGTTMRRYNKLMSESAAAYRKMENERASWYYHLKKKKTQASATGSAKYSGDLTDQNDDAFFQAEAEKEHRENKAKEKSCIR